MTIIKKTNAFNSAMLMLMTCMISGLASASTYTIRTPVVEGVISSSESVTVEEPAAPVFAADGCEADAGKAVYSISASQIGGQDAIHVYMDIMSWGDTASATGIVPRFQKNSTSGEGPVDLASRFLQAIGYARHYDVVLGIAFGELTAAQVLGSGVFDPIEESGFLFSHDASNINKFRHTGSASWELEAALCWQAL